MCHHALRISKSAGVGHLCYSARVSIKKDHCFRYQGVFLTSNDLLSVKQHVDNVVEEAKKKKEINAVMMMAEAGFQQDTLFLLMQMLGMSSLEHGLSLLTLSQPRYQSRTEFRTRP